MIIYSIKALEDLAALKTSLMEVDPVFALVKVTSLIEKIEDLEEEKLEENFLLSREEKYYYKKIDDQVVFLRRKDGEIFIDRIFDEKLDFIKLALDL